MFSNQNINNNNNTTDTEKAPVFPLLNLHEDLLLNILSLTPLTQLSFLSSQNKKLRANFEPAIRIRLSRLGVKIPAEISGRAHLYLKCLLKILDRSETVIDTEKTPCDFNDVYKFSFIEQLKTGALKTFASDPKLQDLLCRTNFLILYLIDNIEPQEFSMLGIKKLELIESKFTDIKKMQRFLSLVTIAEMARMSVNTLEFFIELIGPKSFEQKQRIEQFSSFTSEEKKQYLEILNSIGSFRYRHALMLVFLFNTTLIKKWHQLLRNETASRKRREENPLTDELTDFDYSRLIEVLQATDLENTENAIIEQYFKRLLTFEEVFENAYAIIVKQKSWQLMYKKALPYIFTLPKICCQAIINDQYCLEAYSSLLNKDSSVDIDFFQNFYCKPEIFYFLENAIVSAKDIMQFVSSEDIIKFGKDYKVRAVVDHVLKKKLAAQDINNNNSTTLGVEAPSQARRRR